MADEDGSAICYHLWAIRLRLRSACDYLAGKPIDRHVHPITLLALNNEFFRISFSRLVTTALCDYVNHKVPNASLTRVVAMRVLQAPCEQVSPPLCFFMSLAEIEEAVDALSPEELTRLAAYIARRNKLAWDEELEEDFSPGGKHERALERIDAEIDSGNFTPLP